MTKYFPAMITLLIASAWVWERYPTLEALLATIILLCLGVASYSAGYKHAAEDFDSLLDKIDPPEEK